jgi:predicted nucleotidyltransferase
MRIGSLDIDERDLEQLCERHGVRRLMLFGSRARGAQTEDSDVDLIVHFDESTNRGLSLFEFCTLELELEDLFKLQVDLADSASLANASPELRQSILKDQVIIYG